MKRDEPSERPAGANCSGESGESGKADPDRPESESWRGVVDLRYWRENRGKVGEESGKVIEDALSYPFPVAPCAPNWPAAGLASCVDLLALLLDSMSEPDRLKAQGALQLLAVAPDSAKARAALVRALSVAGSASAVPVDASAPEPLPTPALRAPAPGGLQEAEKSREIDPAAVAQRCAAGRLALVQPVGRGLAFYWECIGTREHLIRLGLCEPSFFPEGRKRLAHERIDSESWREVRRLRGDGWHFRAGGTVAWSRRMADRLRHVRADTVRPALCLVQGSGNEAIQA